MGKAKSVRGGSKKEQKLKAVLVTTSHKGVFFGYVPMEMDIKAAVEGMTVTLINARMVVYWSAATKGVLGLAAGGPAVGSRVTGSLPSWTVNAITGLGEVTEEARKKFEEGMWS